MSDSNHNEQCALLGAATASTACKTKAQQQQWQPQYQPTRRSVKRVVAQQSTPVLDESNHCVPPTTSCPEHSTGNRANIDNVSSHASIKLAAQALTQFRQQAELPPPLAPPSLSATTHCPEAFTAMTTTTCQNLQEKGKHLDGCDLISHSVENMDSVPPSHLPSTQFTALRRPLAVRGRPTFQPHINQHLIQNQINSAAAIAPGVRNDKQSYSAAFAAEAFDGYRAIQDNGIVVPLYPASTEALGLSQAQYLHDTRPHPVWLRITHQPPVLLRPEPLIGRSGLLEPPHDMRATYISNPPFYSIGGSTTAPSMRTPQVDHNFVDFVAMEQPVRSFTTPFTAPAPVMLCSIPGYSSYNEQMNALNQSAGGHGNVAFVNPPTVPTNSTVCYEQMVPPATSQKQSSPAQSQDLAASNTMRDWDINPAFSETAAAALHQEEHQAFPVVLHRVLTELECVPQGSEIATFSPDGKSFQIRNQYLFEKQILPVFFPKMRLFGSFQRQLNLYNFQRSTSRDAGGRDRGSYRHELFQRDCPLKSHGMKRTKIKGGTRRGRPRR